jgi:hypothetical protein
MILPCILVTREQQCHDDFSVHSGEETKGVITRMQSKIIMT